MHTHGSHVLAASSGPGLILIGVGVVIVLALVLTFALGRRRTTRRSEITTPPVPPGPTGDHARRGSGWQTPHDDPDQGHPHP
ncbi:MULTISPECIES: hypothetical protein [unclassified Streptomyces]|uniref:DUF6479 family protein n=1 Tax=unclassified Streptomyces TaxID=2593676 RepID=UPI000DC4A24C|nr:MULTISPECIES: hypothetical protein [unclassified Streptomyces]MYT74941.1 hypothetical protein [Streptomyces sp. SID8367]RAJ91933.1 hypothetical protein K377_00702 [Streptomyces sp. PsTaAH-137]